MLATGVLVATGSGIWNVRLYYDLTCWHQILSSIISFLDTNDTDSEIQRMMDKPYWNPFYTDNMKVIFYLLDQFMVIESFMVMSWNFIRKSAYLIQKLSNRVAYTTVPQISTRQASDEENDPYLVRNRDKHNLSCCPRQFTQISIYVMRWNMLQSLHAYRYIIRHPIQHGLHFRWCRALFEPVIIIRFIFISGGVQSILPISIKAKIVCRFPCNVIYGFTIMATQFQDGFIIQVRTRSLICEPPITSKVQFLTESICSI